MKGLVRLIQASVLWGLCFGLHATSAPAKVDFSKDSVEKYEKLQQFWLLAHAYRYGVVVPKDSSKAVVYEMLYLHCLPETYPFKSRLLSDFTHGFSKSELDKLREHADVLQKRLGFSCPVSNESIQYGLAYQSDSFTPQTFEPFKNFDDFLAVVAESSPQLHKKYVYLVDKGAGRRDLWVFGQLHLQGRADPALEAFLRIKGLSVDDKGFFFIKIDKQRELTINMDDSLYEPLVIKLSGSEGQRGFINLNHLTLQATKDAHLATIVGRHKPRSLNNDNSVILLREKGDEGETPNFIYVTRLAEGNFYKKDLKAGDYLLYLASNDGVVEKEVRVHPGEIKQLKAITLTR
jgi:hypothetical protein